MAFKIECEECGQIGKLIEGPSSVDFEVGDFSLGIIRTGEQSYFPTAGGYDGVELICNRCGNKVTTSQ